VTTRFVTTVAIIIKGSDYSETSRVMSAFARDLGKVRFMAKGARRRTSPFAGLLEPLAQVELVLIPGRSDLYTLKECAASDAASAIRDDLGRLSAGLCALALVDETQIDDDPQPAVFDLLAATLSQLEQSANVSALLFAFQLRLIELSGYRLDLAACAEDGAALGTAAFYSPAHKGLLCTACSRGLKGRRLSAGALSVLRRLDETPLEHVERVKLSAAQTTELGRFFDLVLQTILEKKLTVTAVIRKLSAPQE
jgi:DNA repair protein RecO (recombination protein O)